MTCFIWGAVAVALLASATPTTGATATSNGEPLACPSFDQLKRRVDAKIEEILAFKPGIPLTQFTKHAFRTLNFWDNVGADRETTFGVAMSEGNAQVSDTLVCRFDRADRLRSCKHECCRYTTRTITEAQYKSLAVGDNRFDVERKLCSPSDSEVDPKKPRRVSIFYHIDLPVGHHDEGQTVLLVFEGGKLMSKDMSPYY